MISLFGLWSRHLLEAVLEGQKTWHELACARLEQGGALAKAIDIKFAELGEDDNHIRVERDTRVEIFDVFQTAERARQGVWWRINFTIYIEFDFVLIFI